MVEYSNTDLISRAAAIEVAVSIAERQCPDNMPHDVYMAYHSGAMDVLYAIRALPAAPVAEAQPVAWLIEGYGTTDHEAFAHQYGTKARKKVTPLYAHPPAQPTIGGAELDALVARLRAKANMEMACWGDDSLYREAADAITVLSDLAKMKEE